MSKDYVLKTKNLSKTYGNHTVVANVNLHLEKGKVYGLIGRNGAGKTTIMKMILGLTKATSGTIIVNGKEVAGYDKEIYGKMGSIIEAPGFYPNMTGTENLKLFARLRGNQDTRMIKAALEIANLPYNDKKQFSQYSLGMKQRLGIANAIMNDSEIIILDEPTNGLDPIGIMEMRELIKKMSIEQNKTFLISSHQLAEIEHIVDKIGIIHNGVLLEERQYDDLLKENKKYVYVRVNDTKKVEDILKENGIKQYECEKQTIKLYDEHVQPEKMIRILVENGIDVYASESVSSTLEDYFKTITGGEGIA